MPKNIAPAKSCAAKATADDKEARLKDELAAAAKAAKEAADVVEDKEARLKERKEARKAACSWGLGQALAEHVCQLRRWLVGWLVG